MFPETPFEVLIDAFEKNSGNLDATLAYLLQSKSDPIKTDNQRPKRKAEDTITTFVT